MEDKIMKIVENKKHFLHCNVAGFSYHCGCEVFDQMKIGSKLRLIREDENQFDKNAVAVFFGDTHIGYLPKNSNEQVAMLLELGYEDIFDARVQTLDPEAHPEEQVGMIIYVKRAEKRTKKA